VGQVTGGQEIRGYLFRGEVVLANRQNGRDRQERAFSGKMGTGFPKKMRSKEASAAFPIQPSRHAL
jgi:hypothetical protein